MTARAAEGAGARSAARIEVRADSVRVYFSAGSPQRGEFPYRWLRSHCPRDTDPETGGRRLHDPDPTGDRRPVGVLVDPRTSSLCVVWDELEPGAVSLRESRYEFDWLRRHSLADDLQARTPVAGIPSDRPAARARAAELEEQSDSD